MHERSAEQRRILAVHLPEFLCELALGTRKWSLEQPEQVKEPMAVIVAQRAADVRPQDKLAAVCARAFCRGVRPGQTPAEATAVLAGLRVLVVTQAEVEQRLLALAEMITCYGMTPSYSALDQVDTLWLDISGVAHLHGGERPLCEELMDQVRALGHRVRVAVAGGPRIALANARFGHVAVQLVDSTAVAGAKSLSDLPLAALPLDQECIQWLGRLGLFQVGQIAQLPAAALSSRLGEAALQVLQLVQGVDPTPLVACEFPRTLREECLWEEPTEGLSPLLFALRGIVARLSARLQGRGEACSRISCELIHDPASARHLRVVSAVQLDFDVASPLHHAGDLERVIRTRLAAAELLAPVVGLRVQVEQLTHQPGRQLGLNRVTHGGASIEGAVHATGPWTEEFPVLAAELQADIGSEQVGTLVLMESHIPEDCSAFQPLSSLQPLSSVTSHAAVSLKNRKPTRGTMSTNRSIPINRSISTNRSTSNKSKPKALSLNQKQRFSQKQPHDHKFGLCPEVEHLTRLLPYPQKLNVPLRVGEMFALGHELYRIDKLRFVRRVSDVKWWTESSLHRDYHWAWLRSTQGGTEALLFVDKRTGEGFVQAFCD